MQTTVDGPVVVTLGDSITDGFLSSVGCNRRWPDLLAERFACDPQLSNVAVVNAGISGNRLLASDPLPLFGESALTRLNRDVLGVSGLTHVVVMEGINDLCAEPMASADELIAGIRQIIARVRAQGVRVILATLLPFVGSVWASQDREHARQTVNKWIVGQAEADGVIDFDAAVRDVDQPGRFKSDLHAGDWMHPNDAGYRRMADAVNLALFHM